MTNTTWFLTLTLSKEHKQKVYIALNKITHYFSNLDPYYGATVMVDNNLTYNVLETPEQIQKQIEDINNKIYVLERPSRHIQSRWGHRDGSSEVG